MTATILTWMQIPHVFVLGTTVPFGNQQIEVCRRCQGVRHVSPHVPQEQIASALEVWEADAATGESIADTWFEGEVVT